MRTAKAGSRSAFAAVGAGRFRPQATVKTVGRNVGKSGNRPLFGWCVPLLRGGTARMTAPFAPVSLSWPHCDGMDLSNRRNGGLPLR